MIQELGFRCNIKGLTFFMQLRDRALYNLLRISSREDPSMQVKPWQVEDYRKVSEEALFDRLKELGIPLTHKSFTAYSEGCNTPEELVEFLWTEEEKTEDFDQAYLILFELWRRLLPEKQSLSVFCDELDYRMDLYDQKLLVDEEPMQEVLKDLEDLLDQNVDEGGDPKEVFLSVAEYCAHDLENFIYDYISDQIDDGNEIYASELLDGFYEYVGDPKWFDFLKCRLFLPTDIEKAARIIRGLLEVLQETPDFDLLLEMTAFLAHTEDSQLFLDASLQAFLQMRTEEDFQDLVSLISEYYRLRDNEEEMLFLQKILEARKGKDLSAIPHPSDDLLKEFSHFLASKQNLLKLE